MSSATFQNWLQTRDQHKSYIRDVMSKHFKVCQGNVKTIMNLISKEHGVNIPNGNSYMGFIEDLVIEFSTRDTFAKLN
jgi:hypothetical protein